MPLNPGTRFGSYEVIALIGAGGMGEVYRARDTRLKREVAIKVLPDAFANDPDRLARFQREAELLATLNHPNIGAVYGFEQSESANAIVLELIEGDTLAERLQRGALPVKIALVIALQIAEALEAAHERGVIHRDLKPANIKLTPDDKVKVLDFGLAKAMESTPAGNLTHSPTLSMIGTQAGMILGTAAYMSPEQAKGFPADQRSDVFSFGTVLYEMLTGRQPFHGDTAPDVLASVIVREADLNALPAQISPRLKELIERCLDKNPRKRWQAIGDVRAELEKIATAPEAVAAAVMSARPARATRVAQFALTALTGGIVALSAAIFFRPVPAAPLVLRAVYAIGDDQAFTNTGRRVVAISPDGTKLAYVANQRLFVRLLSQFEATEIGGTAGFNGIGNPVFSPDGESIAFSANDGTLKRIPVTGGAPIIICKAVPTFGLTWDRDHLIFGIGGGGIMRVLANGGSPEELAKLQSGEVANGAQLLPDGDGLLFSLASGSTADRWESSGRIVVQSLKTGNRKILVEGGSDATYIPTGHLVYALSGVLYAARFDPTTLAVIGSPVPVVQGISRGIATGIAQASISQNGTLTYIPGPVSSGVAQRDLALLDRNGNVQPLKLSPSRYVNPRMSPDGKHVAFEMENGKETSIWVYALAGTSQMRRLTFGGQNRYALWSRDGQRIAFQSDREGDLAIFWQRSDGTGAVERLTKPETGAAHHPDAWSPSGDTLLFTSTKDSKFRLWSLSLRDRKTAPFGGIESTALISPAFSPDGRWVAYTSQETGTAEVFVQPFPSNGTKFQISKNNGHDAMWTPNGREIVYDVRAGYSEVVGVTVQPTFTIGIPAPWSRGTMIFAGGQVVRPVDMAPDGRIVGPIDWSNTPPSVPTAARRIHIVTNWFEELKRRVPVARD
jgi:Tol biopolymer transport system component